MQIQLKQQQKQYLTTTTDLQQQQLRVCAYLEQAASQVPAGVDEIDAQAKEYTGVSGVGGFFLGLLFSRDLSLQDAITSSSAKAAKSRVGRGPAAILLCHLQGRVPSSSRCFQNAKTPRQVVNSSERRHMRD